MANRIAQPFKQFLLLIVIAALSCLILSTTQARAEETMRYTIKKGDTLWDISERFLIKPWLWPQLWEQNNYIENPHLIFPDDVLLISPDSIRLIRNTRLRTEKLQPRIRETKHDAITTIDPSAILPFLNQSVIVENGVLDQAAYVLEGAKREIVLGAHSVFYASNLEPTGARQYKVFRIGREIIDPDNGIKYGVEGVHLGTAELIEHNGEVATLQVIDANQEIRPGDRLLPLDKPAPLPRYFPHKPDSPVNAKVVFIPKGVEQAGRRDIVVVSSGRSDQLEDGHVLEVFLHQGTIKDPVSGKLVTLPDLHVATAMIFKVYDQVSYAILMKTSAPVSVGDRVSSP